MELHRATGAALAAVAGDAWPDDATDLARHWLAATSAVGATAEDARRTLDYVEEAAGRAVASLAYEEAADLLARARPLATRIDDPARRAGFLAALGEAQHHAGDASTARHSSTRWAWPSNSGTRPWPLAPRWPTSAH